MAFDNPMVQAGVAGLTDLYAARAATPLEALEVYLSRIDRLDGPLHAVLDIDRVGARAAALESGGRWSEGRPLSPLDGVPVAVKANIAVARLPWHAGIAAYRDRIATEDAACVTALRGAGAIVFATLNLHEGALGATTDNPAFGRCQNPHRYGYTAGGSSGGSAAAVAAGLCAAALGTDTLGSVRVPSAYCGVWGIKPARGAVPTTGVVALSRTLDSVGVHARSAEDARRVLAAIGPREDRPAPAVCLGVLDVAGQVDLTPEVAAGFAQAVAAATASFGSLRPTRLEGFDVGAARRAGLLICEVEGGIEHAAALASNSDGFTAAIRALFDYGARQPPERIEAAHARIAEAAHAIEQALERVDALLLPTTPQTAFPFDAPVPANQADLTALASLLGWPAAAFPIGLSPEGLPLSAQVIARCLEAALAVAERLAAETPTPGGFRG